MAWIDDEIKRIKARDTQQEEDNQLQLHKAAVLRANASHLFSQLLDALGRDIAQFNLAFEGDSKKRRIAIVARCQGGVKLSGASREVLVSLDDSCQTLRYEPSSVGGLGGPPKTIELTVDEGDNVTFRDGTTATTVQRLLSTITADMNER
jgi:hypothetical protein